MILDVDNNLFGILPNNQNNVVRLYIAGQEGVGKTAFIKSVVFGQYDVFLKSTVAVDFLSQNVYVENKEVLLQLWEREPTTSYTCLVVLYDITSRQSFHYAVEKLRDIRTKNSDVPILLVGNKVDREGERCVMSYEGELAALEYQTLFSETTCQMPATARESITDFLKSAILFS